MIIDGKALAAELVSTIHSEIQTTGWVPKLTVFTCSPNFETQKFLTIKQSQAAAAGIAVSVVVLPPTVTVSEVAAAITEVADKTDGIIIQFPFPHLPTEQLIPLIPKDKDVDVLWYDGTPSAVLPPVIGAIDFLASTYRVVFEHKQVVVVGNGRLVGQPAAAYAKARGAVVTVLTKENFTTAAVATADILILGAGVPNLIQPDMVKRGVVVFDAGTSEEGGQLVGDANSAVAERASLFTPVPRGIGPLTVAILLKNVLYLARQHR